MRARSGQIAEAFSAGSVAAASPPLPTGSAATLGTGAAVIVLFDSPVLIDPANPPTTWRFGSAFSLQPGGGFSFGNGVYFIPNGGVNAGDVAVIGPADPAARTPAGGFVNGVTMVVEGI